MYEEEYLVRVGTRAVTVARSLPEYTVEVETLILSNSLCDGEIHGRSSADKHSLINCNNRGSRSL